MSDETKIEETEALAGMAALGALTEEGAAAEVVVAAPVSYTHLTLPTKA